MNVASEHQTYDFVLDTSYQHIYLYIYDIKNGVLHT